MKGSIVRMALVLGIVASAAVASSDAGACGGGEVIPAIDYRVGGIARAEQQLHDGRVLSAAGSVLRMFGGLREMAYGKDLLMNRAFRTLAVAAARNDGALPLEKEVPAEYLGAWRGKTAEERQANLTWSVETLRHLNTVRQNDPALQTDLGEAMSKVDTHHQEALKLLGGLSDKDLVSTPEGYAALAKLRVEVGDKTGSEAAVKRCEAMTKTPGICAVTAAAGGQS